MSDGDFYRRAIGRTVTLQRFSNQLSREADQLITDAYAELERIVRRRPPMAVSRGRVDRRIAALIDEANDVIIQLYRALNRHSKGQWTTLGQAVVRAEAEYLGGFAASGVGGIVVPTRAQVAAIITYNPVEGAILGDWWGKQSRASRDRFAEQVRLGMTRGDTLGEMARRIRGRVVSSGGSRRFEGGSLQVSRSQATALVRTATNEIANAAHLITYEQNADVVGSVEFLAILDERTTVQCGALDGTRWRVDDPALKRPPLHWNCRSTLIPVVAGMISRRRRQTYQEWFAGLDAKQQDRILGPSRGKLYRQGVALDDMIRTDGRMISLDKLRVNLRAA